MPTLQIMSAS